ncbi:MAG: hypothetical protein OEZ36_09400 [Spirochaetota bacterium]|nr:hypothetical protein [Spirochaetota bacterium]
MTHVAVAQSPVRENQKDHAHGELLTVPVFGFERFSLGRKIIASNKKTLASSSMPALEVNAVLNAEHHTIKIRNNDHEYPTKITGRKLKGSVILVNGENYISLVIYKNGIMYSRSVCVLIRCSVRRSRLRFEIIWSEKAIVDLHVDDGKGGKHCYYGRQKVVTQGWNMMIDGAEGGLDLAAITGEGPMSIRVFEAPSGSKIRCYVNYYSGRTNQEVTVRLFQDETLTNVYTHSFNQRDIKATSTVHEKSWVVEEYPW